jgi:HD-GYP domain-containing protein (c-di-GMP phosphodiesterase class II)
MTSARAYRPALPVDEAMAMIRRAAGSHFDPRIVAAAQALHERGELAAVSEPPAPASPSESASKKQKPPRRSGAEKRRG